MLARKITSQLVSTVPILEEDCRDKTSLVATVRPYIQNQTPVILRGAASRANAGANAVECWKTWDHFEATVDGDTPCHVEVGGNYAQSQRCDIRFGDYLSYMRMFEERHGRCSEDIPPSEELVYLAQNDVFEALHKDFSIPDFCTDNSVGEGRLYSTMIWIGPYGCVSPLHFDPMDNALIQFVGRKSVHMYPPNAHVYAGVDGNQYNTSLLNPEKPFDLSKYPRAVDLPPCIEGTIYPGDILYIPKEWWHYIRTVETSVSVNSWWR
jgi:lysine-specific demethylase 8